MFCNQDIAARLESAGFDNYSIDYERGVAYVFFPGLLERETPGQTEERRKREFRQKYYWAGFELRQKEESTWANWLIF